MDDHRPEPEHPAAVSDLATPVLEGSADSATGTPEDETTTRPTAAVVDADPQVPDGFVPLDDVAPELAAPAVVAGPTVAVTSEISRDEQIAEALVRLHEVLVATGRRLDRVIAALPQLEAMHEGSPAPAE